MKTYSADQVRQKIRRACVSETKHLLAKRAKCTIAHIDMLLNGSRAPGPKILKALELRRFMVYADAEPKKPKPVKPQRGSSEGRAKGGLARAASLTAKRRKEIAQKAAAARWGR
jgi:hypothetical protein